MIDAAWTAEPLNRSQITATARGKRLGDVERKECTFLLLRRPPLACYFFFFFAAFFFAVFFAFFAFIVSSFLVVKSPESRPGSVNVKIFTRLFKRIFPLTVIEEFDRCFFGSN